MDWSREELSAAVAAYIEMRDCDLNGEKYTKKAVYERLSKQFGRPPKAFEYRMQNISHVYAVLGRRWVKGLKPASHVGVNVLQMLEELIHHHEDNFASPQIVFEAQVSKLRRVVALEVPRGQDSPAKRSRETTVFSRDPSVVAWVLKNSNGFCEICRKPAPFIKTDGDFYLEVHHLRGLADGGSDTVTNAVAICPNCHRHLHYGNDRDEVKANLYRTVNRLKWE